MNIFSFQKVSQANKMINFSDIDEHEDVVEIIRKRIISNETVYGSIEDSFSMHRIRSNQTALVSIFYV